MGSSLYFYLRAIAFALVMVAIIVFCLPSTQAKEEGNIGKTIAALRSAQEKGATTASIALMSSVRGHSVVKMRSIVAVVQSKGDPCIAAVLAVSQEDESTQAADISLLIDALLRMEKAGVQELKVSVFLGVRNGMPVTVSHALYGVVQGRNKSAVLVAFEGVEV